MSAFSQLTGQQKEIDKIKEPAGKSASFDLTDDNIVPFVSKSSLSCPVPEKIQSDPTAKAVPSHLDHIATLTSMELRQRHLRHRRRSDGCWSYRA